MKYTIENNRGHYEIFDEYGNFISSEDTLKEAEEEVKELQGE